MPAIMVSQKIVSNERPNKKRRIASKTTTIATPRRITRGMTTDAPRKAVFNTPELLENIISFLPPTTVLRDVQRLSHQWRNAVKSSPAIQIKLWLQPQHKAVLRPVDFFDQLVDLAAAHAGFMKLQTVPIYPRGVAMNTVLKRNKFKDSGWEIRTRISTCRPIPGVPSNGINKTCTMISISLESTEQCSEHGKNDPTRKFTAHCRNMFLSDPPIMTGSFAATWGPLNRGRSSSTIRHSEGITLGLLLDVFWASIPQNVFQGPVPYHGSLKGHLAIVSE